MANKFTKLAILPILLTIGLTSCNSDEVKAKPTNYDTPIVDIKEGGTTISEEIHRNINKIIADAYHDGGSFQSDVLNRILYVYATSVFGEYNSLLLTDSQGITLKNAWESANGSDKSAANQFISTHKAFDNGKTGDAKYAIINATWNSIERRISEKMYEKANSDSYKDRNIFYEQKFCRQLSYDLQKVYYDESNLFYQDLILPSVDKENVWVQPGSNGILNRSYYQWSAGQKDATPLPTDGTGARYVEDELIPTIYNELLIEQYILEESPNVLGRSNARKVNIFSITEDNEHILAAKDVAYSLLDRVFSTSSDATKREITLKDFQNYSKIWNGVREELIDEDTVDSQGNDTTLDKIAFSLLDNSEGVTDYPADPTTSTFYYPATSYGKLMKEYEKISDDPYLNDSSVESTFTNSGAYSKELGLAIKTDEILLKDTVTDGWFIKNGNLSELPEAIKTRLFNIAVSDAKKDGEGISPTAGDRYDSTTGTYKVPEDESRYLAKVNGAYYLKTSTQRQGADPKEDILFFDSSTSTYYIVQVEEAASLAKLSTTAAGTTGENVYSEAKRAEVQSEIVKIVATTESYQTLAKKHWIEKMALESIEKYHDQSIYDYFKSNYPDLFED